MSYAPYEEGNGLCVFTQNALFTFHKTVTYLTHQIQILHTHPEQLQGLASEDGSTVQEE